ncbi:S8 family serine peptidase, partial [bacterium]|nr:S8 family serine peptidase [bacterium]
RMLTELAALPFATYLEPAKPAPRIDNHLQAIGTRAIFVRNPNTTPGNLTGKGVTVGLGDTGFIEHIDFRGRLLNNTFEDYGNHGDHTGGTITGAGNINELHTGIAPRATLIVNVFEQILEDAYNNPAIVITSNSWNQAEASCNAFGGYNQDSRSMDLQLNQRNNLIHLFSAGNYHWECSTLPEGFGDLNGGHAAAKNTLTVGGVAPPMGGDVVWSKGPTKDGRIKPEVVANGDAISTVPQNGYASKSGTSMSTPAVAGVLALLVERYRQLHNEDPDGALLKAILCNTANDLFDPYNIYNVNPQGPDFAVGFGMVNARRAIETLNGHQFFSASVSQGEQKDFAISVPSGTKRVKVLLCWNDPAASLNASKTLVNNLDLRVVHHGVASLPLVPDVSDVLAAAAPAVDSVNNIEQVTIKPAASGTHTVQIEGTSVPFGPQKFFITYRFETDSIEISYPVGGETFTPHSTEYIAWEGPVN